MSPNARLVRAADLLGYRWVNEYEEKYNPDGSTGYIIFPNNTRSELIHVRDAVSDRGLRDIMTKAMKKCAELKELRF